MAGLVTNLSRATATSSMVTVRSSSISNSRLIWANSGSMTRHLPLVTRAVAYIRSLFSAAV